MSDHKSYKKLSRLSVKKLSKAGSRTVFATRKSLRRLQLPKPTTVASSRVFLAYRFLTMSLANLAPK